MGRAHDEGAALATDGRPAWVTDELIAETIRVWQPHYDGQLTRDDAIEMLLNVGELFDLAAGHWAPCDKDGDH